MAAGSSAVRRKTVVKRAGMLLLRFFIRVRGAMTATRVPLKENRGGGT